MGRASGHEITTRSCCRQRNILEAKFNQQFGYCFEKRINTKVNIVGKTNGQTNNKSKSK